MSKESILRLKISNTENATIEVLPSDDGVEIIVRRTEKEKPVENKCTDKQTILKDFCTEKKAEYKWDKTMLKELVKFYEWWEPRMEDFKGTPQPEKLWEKWIKTMGKK